jgi:short-subunit dehydrogenase
MLITGASSGIGAATARLFGKEGYKLILAARRLDKLQEVVQDINNKGGNAISVKTDLNRQEDIEHLVNVTFSQYGHLDILFNNAGFGRIDWLEKLTPQEDIVAQIGVNLIGLILLSRAVIPYMIKQEKGHIINMSSVAGLLAAPTYSIYSAGKYGVRGFSNALRREVGIYNIYVSVLYPGGTSTEFSRKARIKRKTGITTPGRLKLSPEDVAEAVLKLVRRPRRNMVIPWQMNYIVFISMFAPWIVDWVTRKYFVEPERLE